MTADTTIATERCPACPLCGSAGAPIYEGLSDRLFGTPGLWRLRRCRERRCGLLWLDPRPTAATIGRAYANYYTHHDLAPPVATLPRAYRAARAAYLRRHFSYQPQEPHGPLGLRTRLRAALPDWRADFAFEVLYLPARPGGRLLDVGSGWGDFLARMAALGWQVEGVDFDGPAVAVARGKGLTVHHGQLSEQAYPAESFDAVTLSHVIEHVHHPLQLLEECRRVLRPGGRLVAVTPNSASLGHRLFRRDWRGLEPPRHLQIFNRRSLGLLAERAGFRRFTVATTVRDAAHLLLASRSLRLRGAHTMGQPEHILARKGALALQLFEWLLLAVDGDAGEELLLIAEK